MQYMLDQHHKLLMSKRLSLFTISLSSFSPSRVQVHTRKTDMTVIFYSLSSLLSFDLCDVCRTSCIAKLDTGESFSIIKIISVLRELLA